MLFSKILNTISPHIELQQLHFLQILQVKLMYHMKEPIANYL